MERQQLLERLLADRTYVPRARRGLPALPPLRPPLPRGFGTLYTAEYRPAQGVARYHWPGRTWAHAQGQLEPGSIQVKFGAS